MYIKSFDQYNRRPYIVGENIKLLDRILEFEDKEGTCFVTNTNVEGIYSYGYQQKKADYFGNPAGYIWSSRASVMNKVFNTTLIDIYYCESYHSSGRCLAIDLHVLEPLLENTEYMIDWTPIVDKEDVTYKLVKRNA